LIVGIIESLAEPRREQLDVGDQVIACSRRATIGPFATLQQVISNGVGIHLRA